MSMLLPQSRTMDFSEVPVIDIGPLLEGVRMDATIEAIGAACSNVGFLYVKNHGIAQPVIDAMVLQMRRFFALPESRKMESSMEKSTQFRGFLPMKSGGKKVAINHREGYIMREDRPLDPAYPLDGPNVWPPDMPAFRDAMMAYFKEAEHLSRCLLQGFSLALGLPAGQLAGMFTHPTTQLKLNYYPAQDRPEKEDEIGIVAHADSGAFTILWQDDVGGLETVNGNGEWVVVPPIPGTFVINIGDILQIWSNGRFSSTPHRVINRYGTDRFSVPLFVHPDPDTLVRPLIGAVAPDYVPFVSGEYQEGVYDRLYPRMEA
ncbi:MAG TPA: 2OG-Fe(II) oxygenase family protein [Bordetella sp.]